MFRAPVVGVWVGAVLVVASQSAPVTGAIRDLPPVACVDATLRTVDARLDHVVDVLRAAERGTDPRTWPAAPTDVRLAACPGPYVPR